MSRHWGRLLRSENLCGLLALALLAGCTSVHNSLPLAAPTTEPVVPTPSAEEPVTAVAWVAPGHVAPGATAEVCVIARIAPGYFLHAADAAPPFVPTSVEWEPADAVWPVGEWSRVGAVDRAGNMFGAVEFRRAVRVAEGAAAGRHEVVCLLRFQACTPELCWPVRVLRLPVSVVVSSRSGPGPSKKETP